MNYIAVKIHNNSLGKCIKVDSIEIGLNILREWAIEDGLEISEEELEILLNEYEVINDDDFDNVYSYSVGICE